MYSGPAPFGSRVCPIGCKPTELLTGEFLNTTTCSFQPCSNAKEGEAYTAPAPKDSHLCPVKKAAFSCPEDPGPVSKKCTKMRTNSGGIGCGYPIQWMGPTKNCPNETSGDWSLCLDVPKGCKPVRRFYTHTNKAGKKFCCQKSCAYEDANGKECKSSECCHGNRVSDAHHTALTHTHRHCQVAPTSLNTTLALRPPISWCTEDTKSQRK